MKNFLFSMVCSILPSLLRLIAAAIEGYFEEIEDVFGVEKGDEKE